MSATRLPLPSAGALGSVPRISLLVVGGDALQPADRHRLRLDAAPPAGGLARPIARPTEDSREDVGVPVDHVGVGVAPGCDQPDVLRYRRVRRAGPLAIDDFVEVGGVADLGRGHAPPRGKPSRGALFGALDGQVLCASHLTASAGQLGVSSLIVANSAHQIKRRLRRSRIFRRVWHLDTVDCACGRQFFCTAATAPGDPRHCAPPGVSACCSVPGMPTDSVASDVNSSHRNTSDPQCQPSNRFFCR